jgi:hypothetical protein
MWNRGGGRWKESIGGLTRSHGDTEKGQIKICLTAEHAEDAEKDGDQGEKVCNCCCPMNFVAMKEIH